MYVITPYRWMPATDDTEIDTWRLPRREGLIALAVERAVPIAWLCDDQLQDL